jgi:aryl-alcohol dehydrogenase-like predicted oxidoreductase
VKKIRQEAAEKRCTPAQLALAWVIAQGDFILAIPGTRRRNHLDENWHAQQVLLTPADLVWIRENLPESAIAGERYTPEVMARVDRS